MEYTFKRFEDLEYSDDWMFKKVMESKDICKKVIERLLHIQIEDISYPVLDQTISPYYTSHGIRLDVYVKDSDRVFDIEIQSYKEDALGKRMRYYQSMVDIDSLMKGDDYTQLKESYIIFICTKNSLDDSKTAEKIFETELDDKTVADRAVFTFKNTCQENTRIKLNDKSIKVIYNANAYESETDPDTKAFLKFVCKNTAGDNLTNEIRKKIADIKRKEANKTEYMFMNLHESDLVRHAKNEGIEEGRLQGIEEGEINGARKKALETAKKLLTEKIPIETIARWTELSVEEIEKLSN